MWRFLQNHENLFSSPKERKGLDYLGPVLGETILWLGLSQREVPVSPFSHPEKWMLCLFNGLSRCNHSLKCEPEQS